MVAVGQILMEEELFWKFIIATRILSSVIKTQTSGQIWMGGGGAGEDLRDLHLMGYALNQLISVCFVTICWESASGISEIEYLRCARKYTKISQYLIFHCGFWNEISQLKVGHLKISKEQEFPVDLLKYLTRQSTQNCSTSLLSCAM